jgi:hypothetical protein
MNGSMNANKVPIGPVVTETHQRRTVEPQQPTDNDIVLRRGGNVAQRTANHEYHKLLGHNVMIYKSLPRSQRVPFSGNLYDVFTTLQNRRFLRYEPSLEQYFVLDEEKGSRVVSSAFRERSQVLAWYRNNPWFNDIVHVDTPGSTMVVIHEDDKRREWCRRNPWWCLGIHDNRCEPDLMYFWRDAIARKWWQARTPVELMGALEQHGLQNVIVIPRDIYIDGLIDAKYSTGIFFDLYTTSMSTGDFDLVSMVSSLALLEPHESQAFQDDVDDTSHSSLTTFSMSELEFDLDENVTQESIFGAY